jgi:hypothetical protein
LSIGLAAASDQRPGTRTTAPPHAPPAPSARDQALQLLAEAQQAYRGVKDYQCHFIKRERLRGKLQADNLIDMKVRTQPFSVYMRWLGPKELEGQQACYIAGRNNGLMRARGTGVTGLAGFVTLDLRDPRVMQNNRHTINEAGIGNLITRLGRRWEMSRQTNATQFQVAEYTYNQRPCLRVDTVHAQRIGGTDDYYRTVVFFDKENRLPIRVENYDWPRAGGEPTGELLESYSYVSLQLNVGLKDSVFNH